MAEFLKNFDLVPFDVLMIVVCAVLFLGLWKFLDKVLFGPYLGLIEAREKLTIGAGDTATAERAKAKSLTEEYEQKLMAARVSAMEKKLGAISKAKTEADSIVEKSEHSSQELLRSVRWEMAKKIDEMRGKAFGEVDSLVDMIVNRVKSPVTRREDPGNPS